MSFIASNYNKHKKRSSVIVENNAIPVKLNYVPAVNANEIQSTDFLVVIKLNYYVYLSSEIILKSDSF